ncbi:MAG: DUF3576 domain-containing protein [Alphaproteobacteria bacterium]|jgi:hypothetical protein|nr:DUF3576 domain-containing protein [Alphaproteobacteria bacterium]
MKKKISTFIYVFLLLLSFSATTFAAETPYKIGVNRFAWYASLKLVNFMPLVSADPFAGVIITDWYSLSETEKYKMDIYILEENLTSNTVQVKVFKQIKSGGTWVNTAVSSDVATKLEDAILNTARQLRIQYLLGEK